MSVITDFFKSLPQKLGATAEEAYQQVFPKKASEYAKSATQASLYSLKSLSVDNIWPLLKLSGSALKSLWATGKIFSNNAFSGENEIKAEQQKANELAYTQLLEAKELAKNSSYELASNLGNSVYHGAEGLLNTAALLSITGIEMTKYVLPTAGGAVIELTTSVINKTTDKTSEIYHTLPNLSTVTTKAAHFATTFNPLASGQIYTLSASPRFLPGYNTAKLKEPVEIELVELAPKLKSPPT